MVKDLFINACILIASISIGNLIFRIPKINSHKNKVAVGLALGVLGLLLMVFSVRVNNILIDFRNIAIILASFLGGAISSAATGIVIGLFRVLYFGLNTSSLIALVTAVFLGLGCGSISFLKIVKWKKWLLFTLFCLITTTISLSIQITDKDMLVNLLMYYWIGTGLMSLIMFFYIDRLIAYNILFNNLRNDATIDFLTGLNNVRQFDKIINRAMLNAKKKEEPLSLIYLDIDFFKNINDTYGHAEGDVILKQFGQILNNNCRSIDYIFRKGGDEFAILLIDCACEKAVEIAQRIRSVVAKQPFVLSTGAKLELTTSVGVASYPETVAEVESLSEIADVALYKAKHSGRNRVETP